MLSLKRARHPLGLLSIVLVVVIFAIPRPGFGLPMPGDPRPSDQAVDQMTGSARVSVPIEVPLGTAGFTPQLALAHASQGGDSPYGAGFGLTLGPVPLGEVRVSTRFLPNGASVTYELDGERLVESGARYHTRTAESFKRITREGGGASAGWLVELPDGTKARYGQDASTRFPTTGTPTRWLLSALTDKSGNTIRIAYSDLSSGTPSTISYSYQGHAPTAPPIGGLREIRFVYETRPDPLYDFVGYELRRLEQRVREIRVLTGGQVFRRYQVNYANSGAGQGRSLVASVQEFGKDCMNLALMPEQQGCVGLPKQLFTYSTSSDQIPDPEGSSSQYGPDDASGVPVPTFFTESTGGPLIDHGVRSGDVNGDGLVDLVQAYRHTNGTLTQRVFLNTGDGWSTDTNNTWTTSLQSISFTDKKIVRTSTPCTQTYQVSVVNKGSERALFSDRRPLPTPVGTQEAALAQSWKLVDLNGDSYADLVTSYRVGVGFNRCFQSGSAVYSAGESILEIWLNDRQGGWVRSALSNDPASYRAFGALVISHDTQITAVTPDLGPVFGDFDGDQLPDLAVLAFQVSSPAANGRRSILTELSIDRSPFSAFTVRALDVPRLPASQGAGIVAHQAFAADQDVPMFFQAKFYVESETGGELLDVNRDGLTDLLKTGLSSSCQASQPEIATAGVWLGKRGGGFCSSLESCPEAARYLPPVGLSTQSANCAPINGGANQLTYFSGSVDAGVRFIEVNGDGWTDLIQGFQPSSGSSTRLGFVFDPSTDPTSGRVWKPDARFAPNFDLIMQTLVPGFPVQAQVAKPLGPQFLDIDADAADDVLYPGGKKIARSTLPDLVKSFNNGRGGNVTFSHATETRQRTLADFTQLITLELSDQALAQSLPAELGLPPGSTYATPLWSKRPVVVTQTLKNMVEAGVPDAVTRFTYNRPGFSLEHRSGLGFAGTLVQRPDGSFVETHFYQQKGVAGQVVSTGVRDSALQPMSEVRQVFAVVDGSLVPGSVAEVPVPRLVATKSRTHYPGDAMPLLQYTQTATFTYNDSRGYNFVSSITEQRNSGKLIKTFTPAPAATSITPTLYLPSLIARAEVKDGADRILSRDDFLYDTLGRQTEIQSLIQARDNPVAPMSRYINFVYDGFGNVRARSTGSAPNMPLVTTFLCFDGDTALGPDVCLNPANSLNAHASVVGTRDELGKITRIEPDPTTGLPAKVTLFNGDVAETVFDRFGRMVERAIDPIRGGVGRTIRERKVYTDSYVLNSVRPATETFLRTGNGSEEIRSVELPDGFGQVERTVEATRTGFAGLVIHRNAQAGVLRQTFKQACSDSFCRDLNVGGFPATLMTLDPLGRVTKMEERGDASTLNSISVARYERFTRSQPASLAPPGASDFFDGVFSKNARGELTRQIMDGNRVVWVDACTNTVAPSSSSLSGVDCTTPDTSYLVYDATGERTRLYDPLAYPSGPFNDPNRYVGKTFDTLGRTLAASDPDGGTTSSAYDVLSNVTQVTNARSQVTTFTYDSLGRLKSINRGPAMEADETYTYHDEQNPQGTRLRSRVEVANSGTLAPSLEEFDYDPFGALLEEKKTYGTLGRTLITRFQTDLLGRQKQVDYPDAGTRIAYTYVGDFLERVCELNASGSCAVDYISDVEYDVLGRESTVFGPIYAPDPADTPGFITEYDPLTYRTAHQELVTVSNFSSLPDARLNHDYGYDELGNLKTIVDLNPHEFADLAPFSDATFMYDQRSRLVQRTLGGVTKHYRYDRLGNLVGNLLNGLADPNNQLYTDAQSPHAIQSAGSTTFAYDADGNMIRRGSQHLSFDSSSRLVCTGTSAGSCNATMIRYNSDDLRAGESAGGTTTLYAGELFEFNHTSGGGTAHIFALGRAIAFKKISSVTLRTEDLPFFIPVEPLLPVVAWLLVGSAMLLIGVAFVRAGGVEALVHRPLYGGSLLVLAGVLALPPYAWAGFPPPPSGGSYRRWVHGDLVGSAVYVSDEQGLRAHKRVFEPFGAVFAEKTSESTPQRFATHLFDAGIGLYYMKARFYDPSVGRFASLDPVIRDAAAIESVNPYSYAENNPATLNDPTGKFIDIGLDFLSRNGPLVPLGGIVDLFLSGGAGLPVGGFAGGAGGTFGRAAGVDLGILGPSPISVTVTIQANGTFVFSTASPTLLGLPTLGLPDSGIPRIGLPNFGGGTVFGPQVELPGLLGDIVRAQNVDRFDTVEELKARIDEIDASIQNEKNGIARASIELGVAFDERIRLQREGGSVDEQEQQSRIIDRKINVIRARERFIAEFTRRRAPLQERLDELLRMRGI